MSAKLAVFVCSLLLAGSLAAPAAVARDDDATCHGSTELGTQTQNCLHPYSRTHAYVAAHSDHVFKVALACSLGGHLCHRDDDCKDDGHRGRVYDIWEDGVKLDWQACLTDHEAGEINGVTPGMIRHAFERLTWPSSPLVIQPPDGKTLVNFDTNFYTTNTDPTTQTVTLLGQRITIEATPVSYVWHFGGEDRATSDPGAAYPDLRITYRYAHAGTVRPSVDTVYGGHYRINAGPWRDIPQTLTVPGTPQALRVMTATPHLVSY